MDDRIDTSRAELALVSVVTVVLAGLIWLTLGGCSAVKPHPMRIFIFGLALAGCGDDGPGLVDAAPGDAAPADAGTDASDAAQPPPAGTLFVTTWRDDYFRLHSVDPVRHRVTRLVARRGYRQVLIADGTLFLYGGGRVERYAMGDWKAPRAAFGVDQGASLVGAALCGGRLFVGVGASVPPYLPSRATTLPAFDPITGDLLAEIDLAPFLPGTRALEVTSLATMGRRLFLTLARGGDGAPVEADGRIVAIDCATGEPAGSWPARGEAWLRASVADPGALWVVQPVVSGGEGLYRLIPDRTSLEGPFFEDALEVPIRDLVVAAPGRMVVAAIGSWGMHPWRRPTWSRLACVDTDDWSFNEMLQSPLPALSFLTPVGEDEVWALGGPDISGYPPGSIFRFRFDGCEILGTPLEVDDYTPVSMAVYGAGEASP